jgi:hypothetical protein
LSFNISKISNVEKNIIVEYKFLKNKIALYLGLVIKKLLEMKETGLVLFRHRALKVNRGCVDSGYRVIVDL